MRFLSMMNVSSLGGSSSTAAVFPHILMPRLFSPRQVSLLRHRMHISEQNEEMRPSSREPLVIGSMAGMSACR
jgi:hypothetical protein